MPSPWKVSLYFGPTGKDGNPVPDSERETLVLVPAAGNFEEAVEMATHSRDWGNRIPTGASAKCLSYEAVVQSVMETMRPPWIPDDWFTHRDFRHGRFVEERDARFRRGWWSDFGDLHTPGERIVAWSDDIDLEEIKAGVLAVDDPALTALWEGWRGTFEAVKRATS